MASLHCLSASTAFPTVNIRIWPHGAILSPLPFGFNRVPDPIVQKIRNLKLQLSPLPFGFNRVPDEIWYGFRTMLHRVSIAFRLQPRSRQ